MIEWIIAYFTMLAIVVRLDRNASYRPHKILFISFSLLIVFVWAGFFGYPWAKGMTEVAWKETLILSQLVAILIISIQFYKKIIINRLMLSMNVFFLVGTMAFLFSFNPILYVYGIYKGATFIGCVTGVGLITTFFFPAGFIGIEHSDKKKIRRASLQLLGASILGLIWAVVMNDYGVTITAVIPFLILLLLNDFLQRQLEHFERIMK